MALKLLSVPVSAVVDAGYRLDIQPYLWEIEELDTPAKLRDEERKLRAAIKRVFDAYGEHNALQLALRQKRIHLRVTQLNKDACGIGTA
jgi:hypothetical protein